MQLPHKFLIFLGCIAVVSFGAYGAVAWTKKPSSVKKPHIVFIIADDMGWNDVSFHGANQIPTPNIDALAYNGVILNRHYVLPICTPSRTSLLTGRYAIKEGMQGWPLSAGEPRSIPLNSTLLPEHLRRLGYSTSLVGKWHVGYLTEDHTPARRGFDTFYGYYNGFITYFDHWIDQPAGNSTVFKGHDMHRDGPDSLKVAYDPVYFTDLITDEAEKIIKANRNDRPLFLEIAHLAVHASTGPETLEVRNMSQVNETYSYIKDIKRRKYAGMVQAMDESVGRVMTALSEAKMLENSIIVFISDNGAPTVGLYENTGSNYPLRGIKSTLFEGGVRGVACVFSPLIKIPGRLSEEPMHIVDWLPTLYAAAGGDVGTDLGGGNIDGVNQWRSLTRGTGSPRRSILLNIDEKLGTEAAILGKHKLLKGAEAEGEGFYGESGNDPTYPAYRVEDALSSPAGSAIGRLTGFVGPTARKASKLRSRSAVHCRPVASYANCSGLCLFDIQNDPCETVDLSKQLPTIVKVLESLIDEYRKVLMPQTNGPVDLCSNPQYFNGTWMPWRLDNITYTPDDPTCRQPEYKFL